MSISVSTLRRILSDQLQENGIDNAKREADLILIHLLNTSYASLLAHPETLLSPSIHEQANVFCARRITKEPLQYILGEADFWGRPFSVGSGVLIPRPETELLVEMALEVLPKTEASFFLDWGTGSSCIASTLMLERPLSYAFMAEKSPRALLQAQLNLKRYRLEKRSLLWHSQNPRDIPLHQGECDLIISNPPYIPTKDLKVLMQEVKDHEPRLALDGGPDGMECYRMIFEFAPLWLKIGGKLLLEAGDEKQATIMREMSFDNLLLQNEVKDLQGITRCLCWKRLAAKKPLIKRLYNL